MREENDMSVNVADYLAVNKYEVDEENPHIIVADSPSRYEFKKLVRVCPAGLYELDENSSVSFDYAGCLECGACRIVCGGTILEKWELPQPGMGVEYRFG